MAVVLSSNALQIFGPKFSLDLFYAERIEVGEPKQNGVPIVDFSSLTQVEQIDLRGTRGASALHSTIESTVV